MKTLFTIKKSNKVRVRISSKCMKVLFVECDIAYIKSNCKGSCCFNSKKLLSVAVSPSEENNIKKQGGIIINGLLQPKKGEKKCPFQRENGLCKIHKKGQPIGCLISPFNLTKNNTVIVRYRNLCMKCHKEGTIPAYKVFRRSLDVMFGRKEAIRICNHLDSKNNDVWSFMKRSIYVVLCSNARIREKQISKKK